jgi:hypothetical protein
MAWVISIVSRFVAAYENRWTGAGAQPFFALLDEIRRKMPVADYRSDRSSRRSPDWRGRPERRRIRAPDNPTGSAGRRQPEEGHMIGSHAVVEDEAIAAVLRLYIDGAGNGDAAKLKEAFHDQARMFGSLGGTRYDVPIAEWFELEASSPMNSDGRYTAHITSIAQAGDVATATVEEDGCWGTVSFTNFFSLAKIDGRWQIVNKAFAHVSGALPSS